MSLEQRWLCGALLFLWGSSPSSALAEGKPVTLLDKEAVASSKWLSLIHI